jgi:hypothetical protein
MIVICAPDAGTPIQWQCSACGDKGVISHQEDSPYDLRRRQLAAIGHLSEIDIPMHFGSVGRPDPLGAEHSLGLAHNQWHSVRRLGQEVADAAAVLPTHGFGSPRSCPAGRKAGHSALAGRPARPSLAAGTLPEPTKRGLKTVPGRPRWQRRNFSAHSPDRPAVPVGQPPAHLTDHRKQERATLADDVSHRSLNLRSQGAQRVSDLVFLLVAGVGFEPT